MSAMDDAILARALRQRREAIEERDRLREAAQAVVDAHSPEQGMGYHDDGQYGHKEAVCRVCGTADEYGVDWPCWTVVTLRALLEQPEA